MFTERDQYWMQHAIKLAEAAAKNNEVPVGAVLVKDDEIISEGLNSPIYDFDPTAHAEILALREGGKNLGNYRLVNTTLYVTLEPCVMCVGAMIHARIQRLVFGAYDPKAGAIDSAFNLLESKKFNHHFEYQGGLFAQECGKLLQDFFKAKR
ncbi:MAG: tRNA adenosine(34) deaminase TadA [Gammaproteobacteria bacterium]|nr:tRNA adenosine(34) deaminase TadA [Gammaproteobacteria bacterium]